jgi:hypothetical protein
MEKELYSGHGFTIIERDRDILFNFQVGEDVFGVCMAKAGITPYVFWAAAANLRDVIKSKT